MGLDAGLVRLLKPGPAARKEIELILDDSMMPDPGDVDYVDNWTVHALKFDDDMRRFRFVAPYTVMAMRDRYVWNEVKLRKAAGIPEDALLVEVRYDVDGEHWIYRRPDPVTNTLTLDSWKLSLRDFGRKPQAGSEYVCRDVVRYIFIRDGGSWGDWEDADRPEVVAMRKCWRDEHGTGIELDTYHPLNDAMRKALVECGYSKEDLENTETSIVCYYENY